MSSISYYLRILSLNWKQIFTFFLSIFTFLCHPTYLIIPSQFIPCHHPIYLPIPCPPFPIYFHFSLISIQLIGIQHGCDKLDVIHAMILHTLIRNTWLKQETHLVTCCNRQILSRVVIDNWFFDGSKKAVNVKCFVPFPRLLKHTSGVPEINPPPSHSWGEEWNTHWLHANIELDLFWNSNSYFVHSPAFKVLT